MAESLEAQFQRLAKIWKEETAHLSSVTEMAKHSAYQEIIAMGWPVVPLILQELRKEPDHWFWALAEITGENPVPAEDAGNLEKMTHAWLAWGETRCRDRR